MEQHPDYRDLRDGDLTAYTYGNGEIFVGHESGAIIRVSPSRDGMVITVHSSGGVLMTPWALNGVPAIKVFKPR